jgi:3-hydroxybutyryl-CoA dehydratase
MENAMKYEDIVIGQKAELSRKITFGDMLNFMITSGDKNKLHIDEDYTKGTEFKIPVVYGMLTASFISTVIGNQLPGDGAIWVTQSMRFIRPVYIGDTITVKAEVSDKRDNEKIIVLQTDVYNQRNEVVIYGMGSVKILEK